MPKVKVSSLFVAVTAAVFSALSVQAQSVEFPTDPEKFHIFLLMGQSNMVGSSAIDGPMDTETHPRILKLNAWNSWELAKDPVAKGFKKAIGPGLSFAKRMVEEQEDIVVGLVPLAVGGTRISQWSRGSSLYNATIRAANLARRHGTIKGILWHQGEHDGLLWTDAEVYLERLQKLTDDLRVDLGDVDLPFITGGLSKEISESIHKSGWRIHNLIQHNARVSYRTGYVRTLDLDVIDPLHFSAASMRVLGVRYADEFLRVSGYWTEKGKATLDEEAQEMEGGWKFHPSLGLYYDAHFPIIHQAQLGWVVVDFNADGSINFRSKYYELDQETAEHRNYFRSFLDGPEHGLYLYRENIDQEKVLYGDFTDVTFMFLLADPNWERTFYTHTTETWSSTLAQTPPFTTVEDFYYAAETHFALTQEASARTAAASMGHSWSDVRKYLKETEIQRELTIRYSHEAIWFAHRNLQGNPRVFWMNQASSLVSRIDGVLIDAQLHYQDFVYRLGSRP